MSILNLAALRMAKTAVASAKVAFTPMDPSQMAGQQGGQPGGDPGAAQGGPVDPSQISGIGSQSGSSGSGGGAVDQEMIRNVLRQELQQILPQMGGGGGGAGGGMGPGGKPMKLDVGVELHRLNVMLAKIIDALGLQIPASDMVTTEEQGQQPSAQNAGMTGAPQPPASSISPIQPMQPAGPGHQATDKASLADETARKFMDQGECNSEESILPLSTSAAAASLIMRHLPAIQDQIA
jgi:hypothetical protein